jgi:hypothetical protein
MRQSTPKLGTAKITGRHGLWRADRKARLTPSRMREGSLSISVTPAYATA